ncbi:Phosphate regulon transcriptional regulatory protein phoB [Moraxella lacunata]|uniref:Phosphate regulon transcriptional regulatory protein PhoB n=1 Tax=Moraxella lacunata TaxID=477 RepID=A0A378TPE6_MORLA|nr:phosphate regulon transcriptional regulator PhoB [Moraxella lacunata]STZ62749.1 Phosphate regulon transcriptional regulatory protein phoB [Moraxella lacunata]
MPTILIVEDEPAINELIATTLQMADFETVSAYDVKTAHRQIVDARPDLMILDWMLPQGTSGLDFCRLLKKDSSTDDIPIIMLTAKGEEDNKVLGLDAGADDYMTKPFSTKELVSRVKAVLRRSMPTDKVLSVGELCLDDKSQRVSVAESPVAVSSTEYKLLKFFMTHPERVYSRSQILDHVWGGNVYIDERTIDVHIRRLRRVLAPHGVDGLIQTVRGTGYRFSNQ